MLTPTLTNASLKTTCLTMNNSNDEMISVENVNVSWNLSLPLKDNEYQLDNNLLNILFLLTPGKHAGSLFGHHVVKRSLEKEQIATRENLTFYQDIVQARTELQQLRENLLDANQTLSAARTNALQVWEDNLFINDEIINRTTFMNSFDSFYEYYLAYYLEKQKNSDLELISWLEEVLNAESVNEIISDYFYNSTGLNIYPLNIFTQSNFTEIPSVLIDRLNPLIADMNGKISLEVLLTDSRNYTREISYEDYQAYYFLDIDESFTGKLANGSMPVNQLGNILNGDEIVSVVHLAVVTENKTGKISRNVTWRYDNGTISESPAGELVKYMEWVESGSNGMSSTDTGLASAGSLEFPLFYQYFGSGANTSGTLLPDEGIQEYLYVEISQYRLHQLDGTLNTQGFSLGTLNYEYFGHVMNGMLIFSDNKSKNGLVDLNIDMSFPDWQYLSSSTEIAQRVDMTGFDSHPLFSGFVFRDRFLYFTFTLKNVTVRLSDYRASKLLADFKTVPSAGVTVPELSIRFLLASYFEGKIIDLKMDMKTSNWNSSQPGTIDDESGLSLIFATRSYWQGSGKITGRMDRIHYLDPDFSQSVKLSDYRFFYANDVLSPLTEVRLREFRYLLNDTKPVSATAQVFPRAFYRLLRAGSLFEAAVDEDGYAAMEYYFFLVNYPEWGGLKFEHGPEFYLYPGKIVKPITSSDTTDTGTGMPENSLWNIIGLSPSFLLFFVITPIFIYYCLPKIFRRYRLFRMSKSE